MAIYILYNPLCNNKKGEQSARALEAHFPGETLQFFDATKLDGYAAFLKGLDASDRVVLCGGDGTLNRFASELNGEEPSVEILYFPAGTGNDFWHDLGGTTEDAPRPINQYLRNLPKVTVKGQTYAFLNGVGYGIDGYCCEEGDKLRAVSDKPINYSAIAIKGLLFHFKPRTATVTVDGQTHTFKKVWIAPVMHGRFYGGGMMMAPDQIRNNPDGTLSLVMFHGSGKLKTLMIFPSIFKGEHVKHTKHIAVLTGKTFDVAFDRPTPLQVDGETVLGVEGYHVEAGAAVPCKEEAVAN